MHLGRHWGRRNRQSGHPARPRLRNDSSWQRHCRNRSRFLGRNGRTGDRPCFTAGYRRFRQHQLRPEPHQPSHHRCQHPCPNEANRSADQHGPRPDSGRSRPSGRFAIRADCRSRAGRIRVGTATARQPSPPDGERVHLNTIKNLLDGLEVGK